LLQALAWSDPPRPFSRPDRPLTLREIRTVLRIPAEGASREAIAAQKIVTTPTFWLALGGMSVLPALGHRRPERSALWAGALGLLGLAELGTYGHALLRVAPTDAFLGPDPISSALAAVDPPGSGPVRIRARDILYHDLRAWSHGIEKIN